MKSLFSVLGLSLALSNFSDRDFEAKINYNDSLSNNPFSVKPLFLRNKSFEEFEKFSSIENELYLRRGIWARDLDRDGNYEIAVGFYRIKNGQEILAIFQSPYEKENILYYPDEAAAIILYKDLKPTGQIRIVEEDGKLGRVAYSQACIDWANKITSLD